MYLIKLSDDTNKEYSRLRMLLLEEECINVKKTHS